MLDTTLPDRRLLLPPNSVGSGTHAPPSHSYGWG